MDETDINSEVKCRNAAKVYQKKYRLEHKEEHKAYHKKYNKYHKEHLKKYYKEHRLELIARSKKWRLENKEKTKKYQLGEHFKDYQKKYRLEHKEEARRYRLDHKEEIRERRKKYRLIHRDRHKKWYLHVLKSWESYIPKETICEICGKKIFFCKSNIGEAICFDHKHENCAIKVGPTLWLSRHHMTKENKKIWESCKFGFLCGMCNSCLPSKNRKEWLKKVNVYVNK